VWLKHQGAASCLYLGQQDYHPDGIDNFASAVASLESVPMMEFGYITDECIASLFAHAARGESKLRPKQMVFKSNFCIRLLSWIGPFLRSMSASCLRHLNPDVVEISTSLAQ
jgi:hypothetical protein